MEVKVYEGSINQKHDEYFEKFPVYERVSQLEREIDEFYEDSLDKISDWNDEWDENESFSSHDDAFKVLRRAMDLMNACHRMEKGGRVPVGIVNILKVLQKISLFPLIHGDEQLDKINDIANSLILNSEDTYVNIDLLMLE